MSVRIKIAFIDFWDPFVPENNFFFDLFKDIYGEVEVTSPEAATTTPPVRLKFLLLEKMFALILMNVHIRLVLISRIMMAEIYAFPYGSFSLIGTRRGAT